MFFERSTKHDFDLIIERGNLGPQLRTIDNRSSLATPNIHPRGRAFPRIPRRFEAEEDKQTTLKCNHVARPRKTRFHSIESLACDGSQARTVTFACRVIQLSEFNRQYVPLPLGLAVAKKLRSLKLLTDLNRIGVAYGGAYRALSSAICPLFILGHDALNDVNQAGLGSGITRARM